MNASPLARFSMPTMLKERPDDVACVVCGELVAPFQHTRSGGWLPRTMHQACKVRHEAELVALDGAQNIVALAADTDGIDGGDGSASDPAGAIVDETTLERARSLGLEPAKFLENNDSTSFFTALDDLVITGPTHTNVNDFRVILIDP